MLEQLKEFTFDPPAAQRIAQVVEQYPMSLENCADVLEAVAPYCALFTTDGFIQRLRMIARLEGIG